MKFSADGKRLEGIGSATIVMRWNDKVHIAGVAVAIQLGGPGAIFWMWVTAIFGIATKFFTCTLSVLYRDVESDGSTNAAVGSPIGIYTEEAYYNA